jgi:predicted nuclease of restriction endonuclease-like (RecB) superfamily
MSKDALNFNSLVSLVEQTHVHFQQQAVKAVNVSLTIRNWLVGYYIVEFEQKGEDRAEYGSKLLSKLAESSKHIKGFDERSFRNFRLFYKQYPQIHNYILSHFPNLSIWGSATAELDLSAQYEEIAIRGSLTTESENATILVPAEKILSNLSYTHLELLFTLDDPLKRAFYEIECIKGTWSVRELKRQINSLYFERMGMSQKPELLSELTQQEIVPQTPNEIVKSVYAFEFLGLNAKDAVEEEDLETALLDHLQAFMLEMGHGFCLEARQKKILIGDEYFFVDLVFYHRILKCHVLVELKVEDFNHHNIGQLNTYVNYYKSKVMQADDNPTIGILLVTNKNNALVEFATAGIDNQLFVSKYLIELPSKETLESFILKEVAAWK